MTTPHTQAALAAELGISTGMVSRLAKQGMPIHDAAAARAWRAQHVRPRAKLQTDEGTPASAGQRYAEARACREESEAALAALRLAEERGQLVRAADIERALARVFASCRDALLAIPHRLAPVVAAEQSQTACFDHIDKEIRAALEHLRQREA